MDEEKMVLELLAAAGSAGIDVREVPLSSGETKARSGLVVLRGTPVLFLDKNLPPRERAGLIAGALRGMDLDNVYLSPAARSIIEDPHAPAEKPDH
jgi:hypothetical protein